ncbi:MAG: hypothetical protein H7Z14_04550 [Anaerolineae bacterium]|nr:hypothetical protein [Phycisphaerae bacterium]
MTQPHFARRISTISILVALLSASSSFAQSISNPAARLVGLGMKFDGATTCNAAKCHGGGDTTSPPTKIASEYNVWLEKDAHAYAFKSLTKPKLDKYTPDAYPDIAKIGANLKIADVTKDNRCLVCHSLPAPANLHGEKFSLAEGNTCAACHGPSEKWRGPHEKKEWTAEQRKKYSKHEDLLKNVGIYDTRVVTARAELCVGCHLAIDADLVTAGHPQPVFELQYYQDELENKHWMTDPAGYFPVKLWATGQVASVRDALLQLEARNTSKASDDLVTDAYQQVVAHWTMVQLASQAGGLKGDVSGIDSAVKTLIAAKGKDAAAAKAGAAAATSMLPSCETYNPDRKAAAATLQAVATSTLYADAGIHGARQQTFAVYSLFNAIARNEKLATADAVNESIGKLFAPPGAKSIDPAQFAKDLDDVKSKLPK